MQSISLKGYSLVHQGGHHDVFCDGKLHAVPYYPQGGFCYPPINVDKVIVKRPLFKCNCKHYESI